MIKHKANIIIALLYITTILYIILTIATTIYVLLRVMFIGDIASDIMLGVWAVVVGVAYRSILTVKL